MDGCVFFVASQPCLAVFGQEECSTFIHHHHHYFHSLSVRWSTKHISSTTSQGFNCWVGGRGRDFGRRPTVDHQGLSYIQESSRETRDERGQARDRERDTADVTMDVVTRERQEGQGSAALSRRKARAGGPPTWAMGGPPATCAGSSEGRVGVLLLRSMRCVALRSFISIYTSYITVCPFALLWGLGVVVYRCI